MKKLTFSKWDSAYQNWRFEVVEEANKKYPDLADEIVMRGEICENGSIYLGNLHWLKGFTTWKDSKYFCE